MLHRKQQQKIFNFSLLWKNIFHWVKAMWMLVWCGRVLCHGEKKKWASNGSERVGSYLSRARETEKDRQKERVNIMRCCNAVKMWMKFWVEHVRLHHLLVYRFRASEKSLFNCSKSFFIIDDVLFFQELSLKTENLF